MPNSERLASSASPVSSDLSNQVDALRGDLATLADAVGKASREQLQGVVQDARQAGEQQLENIEAMIRRNPTQSALIAAGVGFVVALMMLR